MSTHQDWYYLDSQKEQIGPISSEELQQLVNQKTIVKKTLVWTAELDEWVKASKVGGLFDALDLAPQKPKKATPAPRSMTAESITSPLAYNAPKIHDTPAPKTEPLIKPKSQTEILPAKSEPQSSSKPVTGPTAPTLPPSATPTSSPTPPTLPKQSESQNLAPTPPSSAPQPSTAPVPPTLPKQNESQNLTPSTPPATSPAAPSVKLDTSSETPAKPKLNIQSPDTSNKPKFKF